MVVPPLELDVERAKILQVLMEEKYIPAYVKKETDVSTSTIFEREEAGRAAIQQAATDSKCEMNIYTEDIARLPSPPLITTSPRTDQNQKD